MGARRTTAPLVIVLVTLAWLGAARCGSGSLPSPVTGIDELTIPQPDPLPGGFVDRVDNPWVGLAAGSRTFTLDGTSTGAMVVAVAPGPAVDGIVTTAVTTSRRTSGGAPLGSTVDYYAQDDRGNVWWFGRAGEWQAGEAGAQAGLLMAAEPRLGDGYVAARTPDGDVRAEVVATDGRVIGRGVTYDGTVVIDTTDPDGHVERTFWARGTGLVYQATQLGSPSYVAELVPPGQ